MVSCALFQNVRRPIVRTRFNGIAARADNYVASATTLVEHTRRIMRARTGPIAELLDAGTARVASDNGTRACV